jgi:hypothetical protein
MASRSNTIHFQCAQDSEDEVTPTIVKQADDTLVQWRYLTLQDVQASAHDIERGGRAIQKPAGPRCFGIPQGLGCRPPFLVAR